MELEISLSILLVGPDAYIIRNDVRFNVLNYALVVSQSSAS